MVWSANRVDQNLYPGVANTPKIWRTHHVHTIWNHLAGLDLEAGGLEGISNTEL